MKVYELIALLMERPAGEDVVAFVDTKSYDITDDVVDNYSGVTCLSIKKEEE